MRVRRLMYRTRQYPDWPNWRPDPLREYLSLVRNWYYWFKRRAVYESLVAPWYMNKGKYARVGHVVVLRPSEEPKVTVIARASQLGTMNRRLKKGLVWKIL